MGGLGDEPLRLLRGGPRGNRSKIRLLTFAVNFFWFLIVGLRGNRSEQGQGWGMGGLGLEATAQEFDCHKTPFLVFFIVRPRGNRSEQGQGWGMGGLGNGPLGLLRGGPRGNRSKIRLPATPKQFRIRNFFLVLIVGPRDNCSEQGQGRGMRGLGDGWQGLLRGEPRGNRSKIRLPEKNIFWFLIVGPRGNRSEQGQGWGMGGLGDGPLGLLRGGLRNRSKVQLRQWRMGGRGGGVEPCPGNMDGYEREEVAV